MIWSLYSSLHDKHHKAEKVRIIHPILLIAQLSDCHMVDFQKLLNERMNECHLLLEFYTGSPLLLQFSTVYYGS